MDWNKLNDAGVQAYLEGQDGQAKDFFKAAIREAKHSDRPKANLSASLFGLAQLYYMQQRYEKAEPLYKKALEIDEKVLGPKDPEVALRLTSLVSTYRHLGKFDEAEPLLLRALAIRENALGADDPLVGNTLLDLTTLYVHQGKYAVAEPLCKRAVSIREKTLGADNLRLVPPLKIYANLLRKLDREPEAAGIESRATEIETKQHP